MSGQLKPVETLPKNFRCLIHGLDPSDVLRRLAAMPELWQQVTARQSYDGSAHRDTETIFLRAPARLQDVLNVIETVPMPALRSLELEPILAELANDLGIRDIGRAMLVKLKPNGVISPHIDEGAYARYYARFHCVLSTSPDCLFYSGDDCVHMSEGECWWFNHRATHHVHNGAQERIHLIFDGCAPGFTGVLT